MWRTNLIPFLEMVSSLVRYSFDQWDVDAVCCGLGRSDAEHDGWFEYPIAGQPTLRLRCAVDIDADEHVMFKIDLVGIDESLATRLALLFEVFSAYRLNCD